MAFVTSAVQLALAHSAVDVLTQSMASRLAAVQLAMTHGDVDVFTHLNM